MKVTIARNPSAALSLGYRVGEEVEVTPGEAQRLMKLGIIESVVIEAVPPAPAIQAPGTVEKATADLKAYKAKESGASEKKPSK